MRIGVIGQGYVGSAIKLGFDGFYDVETYDKFDETKSSCDLDTMTKKCEIIFVCVPTPMKTDGSCDISIVESVIEDIGKSQRELIVVIKSTVPPSTTNELNKKYKKSLHWLIHKYLLLSNLGVLF